MFCVGEGIVLEMNQILGAKAGWKDCCCHRKGFPDKGCKALYRQTACVEDSLGFSTNIPDLVLGDRECHLLGIDGESEMLKGLRRFQLRLGLIDQKAKGNQALEDHAGV